MSAAVASSSTTASLQQQQRQQQQQPSLSTSETTNGTPKEALKQAPIGPEEDSKPAALASKETKPEEAGGNNNKSPLSLDLKRILVEVAKTGRCSFLAWDSSDADKALLSTNGSNGSTKRLPFTSNSNSNSNNSSTSARKQQQRHSFQRQRPTPLYASAAAAGPPRKKHRSSNNNGMHSVRQRRFEKSAAGRKRPLFLIRTSTNTNTNAFSPGSVESGRTSGSEPEDTLESQYECDSEGTSATSNSELSFERRDQQLRKLVVVETAATAAAAHHAAHAADEALFVQLQIKSLKDVFRTAMSLVLDHFYNRRGGYKLSPAEKRRNAATLSHGAETVVTKEEGNSAAAAVAPVVAVAAAAAAAATLVDTKSPSISAQDVFQQRRQRLLAMLGQPCTKKVPPLQPSHPPVDNGPPFTIQRIAEVLVNPERYYTQTHKICNCLEKLLLVTSSTGAFGGIGGGNTSQSRREERELAALADERGRLHSEFRQRRLRRRASDDIVLESADGSSPRADTKRDSSPEKKKNENGVGGEAGSDNAMASSREILEAAARAALRTKFDHVGIDPHSSADARSIAENRGMTNSPPPPGLGMAAAPGMTMPGHGSLLRQHHPDQVPSPILFNAPGEGSPPPSMAHANTNMHLLHMHHAAAFAGVSTFELMGLSATDHGAIAGAPGLGAPTMGLKDVDLESRSSASSDVDSESDDVSFDDSASDRSDGSDSGNYEPFSAARAMALNRMQQQQRLQSRMLTSLATHHQAEGFRPPADSEYQSGDSIDSMRAEDSGGSDSSSDVAD